MPLLPVRSLFWRAFLTFWSAMALILVCGMLFTAAVAWYRVNSLDGLNPGSLATTPNRARGRRGRAGTLGRGHGCALQRADLSGGRLRPRHPGPRPARARCDWLKDYRAAPPDPFPASSAPSPSVRVSWWDPQLLALPDGRELLMLFLPFDSSHWELLGLAPSRSGRALPAPARLAQDYRAAPPDPFLVRAVAQRARVLVGSAAARCPTVANC